MAALAFVSIVDIFNTSFSIPWWTYAIALVLAFTLD